MRKSIYNPILIITLAILFTVFSETASNSALSSLKNCFQNIIPSLFPFMVISSMIIYSGAADILGRLFPISRIYSLPGCASASIIIGAISGFPLGAKAATELFERGYINKTETEILISISNNTGPTFLIFVIGAKYWNDINLGIFMYIAQIICSIVSSLIINKLFFPTQPSKSIERNTIEINNITESLSKSIVSATLSSINICGFITFFAVLSSVISDLIKFSPVNIRLLILSFLEFSDASLVSSEYKSIFSVFICAFAIGWSGLSVFCQTASFTSVLKLSLKRCILTKLLQGILMGISTVIYKNKFTFSTNYDNSLIYSKIILYIIIPIFTLLLTLSVFYIIKKRKGA